MIKVISTFLKDPSSYGTAKHTGRPSKLGVRDKRAISRSASNTTKSCTSIRNELNLPVSRWTVNRAFNSDRNIVRSKMAKCPRLDKSHKAARLEYARKYMTWNEKWTIVIFGDEKKFNLDCPDGFNSYWRDLRKEPRYYSKRNFGGGNVMVFACFSSYGRSKLTFIDHPMDSLMYQNVLGDNLMPYMKRFRSVSFKFMQDNASCHASAKTKKWISDKKISLIDHPSRNPDLNPIKNL
uniref:DDE_3 domain-containing protein n=1 Tax=Strongyloides papillosus TaxID=174720 RepID=A0A0N5BII7_STREA